MLPADCTAFCDRTRSVADWGGDEFAIAFDDLAFDDIGSADEVEKRFQTILDSFERPFSLVGNQIRIRASLGYGSMPDDADSLEDLVIVADLALYHAKESGRNQIRAFDATLRDRATGRARALLDLRRALIDEEFELVYQHRSRPRRELSSGSRLCCGGTIRLQVSSRRETSFRSPRKPA